MVIVEYIDIIDIKCKAHPKWSGRKSISPKFADLARDDPNIFTTKWNMGIIYMAQRLKH